MIKRELKDFTWEFNEESKTLKLRFFPQGITESVDFEIDKIRMLSLARFILRVLASMTVHRRKTV